MDTLMDFASSWICLLGGSVLLALLCAFMMVRWLFLRHLKAPLSVSVCPRCAAVPPQIDFFNRCSRCGREYDKWGNILGMSSSALLSDLDLAHFDAKHKRPNPPDKHYQPGSSQELTP